MNGLIVSKNGFRSLKVKRERHNTSDVSDSFFKVMVPISKDIQHQSSEYENLSKRKREDVERKFREAKIRHQKMLEGFAQEAREVDSWDRCVRSLEEFARHAQSHSLLQLVARELVKQKAETDDFLRWRAQTVQRFEQSLTDEKQAVQYTDAEQVLFIFRSNGMDTFLLALSAWIDKCKALEKSIADTTHSAQQLLSSGSATVAAAEGMRGTLEKFLNDKLLAHLHGGWATSLREWIAKCDEIADELRVQQEMVSATSALLQRFPFIARAHAVVASTRKYYTQPLTNLLSREKLAQWQMLSSGFADPHQFLHIEATRKISLADLCKLLIAWGNFLQELFREDKETFSVACAASVEVWFAKFTRSSSVEDVSLVALAVYGTYRLLTSKPRDLFAKILRGKLFKYQLLIPSFLQPEKNLDAPVKEQADMALLLGCIVGYSADNCDEISGPLNASFAWTFLVRITQQLHFITQNRSSPGAVPLETVSANTACLVIYQFLQTAGFALFSAFQSRAEELLRGLLTAVNSISAPSSVVLSLKELIATALRDKSIAPVFFNNQDPPVVDFTLLAGSSQAASTEFEELAKDKTSPFMQRVKALQISRTRAIFNRVSATEESQQRACKQIIEKIVEASPESPQILRYTLHKIVDSLLEAIQEESFSQLTESQPVMFARVACMVCKEIEDMAHLLRSLIYRACPPLMPKVVSEDVSNDDFLRSMGFLWKPVKDSDEQRPETIKLWIARMEKIVTVVAVMSIQPEETPFSLDHMWSWLARTTNYASRFPKPPFYLASMYNAILRITSAHLLKRYGNPFLSIVKIIQTEIFPKLEQDSDKQRLGTFLEKFVSSNGQVVERFFSD